MRIGINITPLIQDKLTGVQLIAKYLTEQLIADNPHSTFVLTGLIPRRAVDKLKEWPLTHQKNVILKVIPVPARVFHRLGMGWQRLGIVPIEQFTGYLDIFHQFDWFCFPSQALQTATVYDCTPVLFPQWHTPENRAVFNQRMRRVTTWAATIFTLSMATHKDIQLLFPDISKRLQVVYPDCSGQFVPLPEDQISTGLVPYHLKPGYLLFVGTVEPRKNLENVLLAYHSFRARGYSRELVVIGGEGWNHSPKLISLLKSDGVKWLNYIENMVLPVFYNGAYAFLYPSLYEGFGLPVLEALRCKTLVITSKVSSLPEVAGKQALYCNPLSPGSIEETILQAEALKKDIRQTIIEAGFNYSQRFSYKTSATMMMNTWKKMVKR